MIAPGSYAILAPLIGGFLVGCARTAAQTRAREPTRTHPQQQALSRTLHLLRRAVVLLSHVAPAACRLCALLCLLSPRFLMGMLAGAIASGCMLAIMMANAGGAWDNSKKVC
eukprot:1618528-Pleurochrysis_carterae.AAC.2